MWQTVTGVLSRATLGDWLLLCAGLLLLLYVAGTWNYDYFRKRGIPSTRPRLPFVGDVLDIVLARCSLADAMQTLYERGKAHGVLGAFIFVEPAFLISDPEVIKAVAVKEFDSFMNHRTLQIDKCEPVFSKNLFNLKDQQWRDMRATLSPAFTTSKIKGMFPLISRCGEQMVRNLRQKYADSAEGTSQTPLPTDMKDLSSRMANDVIATAAYGLECDSLKDPENEFYRMGRVMTTFTKFTNIVFFGYLFLPRIMHAIGIRIFDARATAFFNSLIHETVRERQRLGIFRPDMLQLLMQAQKGELQADKEDADEAEDVGTKKKLTDDDIAGHAMFFFFAGLETVSTVVCLATHLLSHHPDQQKRLQAEIGRVMEETDGKPTYEAVQSMEYLDAVISETLRLYPTNASTDRICQRDTVLPATGQRGPIVVPKGTNIQIPIVGLHHDPKYWEEPEKFDPERFSAQNKHKVKPFAYMPFGVGPRICIGQRFALIEVKLALLHFLHNFDLHPSARTKRPIEFLPGLNVAARGGYWCEITPRDVEA